MQIRRQRPRTAANGFEKQDEASEAFKDIIIKYNIINDMTRHKLSGAGAAIPTPFTPDGRVDYPALARTIDYIIDGGVDFIVALGTTAETPTLYLHERAVVAMFIKNHIAGRVPLVIGVGGNSTSEVLDQLREFDLRGGGCDPERHTLLQQTVAGGGCTSTSKPYRNIRPCRSFSTTFPAVRGSI